jgi:hypothetical protein
MAALHPKNPTWVVFSEALNSAVTICEDDGKLWLCFKDGIGRWHKEHEASPELIRAFESGDSIEAALRWEPE